MIVNDIYASCYAAISHNVAHIGLAPMRWFPWLLDSDPNLQGARPYVKFLKQLGIYLLPDAYKTDKYRKNSVEIDYHLQAPSLSQDMQICHK